MKRTRSVTAIVFGRSSRISRSVSRSRSRVSWTGDAPKRSRLSLCTEENLRRRKEFPSAAEAKKEHDKLVGQKLHAGYVEQTSGAAPSAKPTGNGPARKAQSTTKRTKPEPAKPKKPHECYVIGVLKSESEIEGLLVETDREDEDAPISRLAAALGITWYDHDKVDYIFIPKACPTQEFAQKSGCDRFEHWDLDRFERALKNSRGNKMDKINCAIRLGDEFPSDELKIGKVGRLRAGSRLMFAGPYDDGTFEESENPFNKCYMTTYGRYAELARKYLGKDDHMTILLVSMVHAARLIPDPKDLSTLCFNTYPEEFNEHHDDVMETGLFYVRNGERAHAIRKSPRPPWDKLIAELDGWGFGGRPPLSPDSRSLPPSPPAMARQESRPSPMLASHYPQVRP